MRSSPSHAQDRSTRQGWSGTAARLSSQWAQTWSETLLAPLFDPLQSPLPRRVRALGVTTAVGHPLFHLLWTHWAPQPYDDFWGRVAMSLLGLVLVLTPALSNGPSTRGVTVTTSLIFWITLPVYFTWMYLCNSGSPVWFASAAAMVLIYLNLTDWRLASLGLLTGVPVGGLLFYAWGPDVAPLAEEATKAQAVVLSFCVVSGFMLGTSSVNLRREQLKQAVDTMGIMAHELRTPLATMNLLGEAIRQEARRDGTLRKEPVEQHALRLLALVRNMHRQIDTQITNARLLRLPPAAERVSAAGLLRETLAEHPFRHETERNCIELHVHRDFEFETVRSLFGQVIDNLLRNALRALSSLPGQVGPGDLQLVIDQPTARWGRIRVIDRGTGIAPHLQARLFQPFVSSHQSSGHGLGLAFCLRMVQRSGGRLSVESTPGQGATFIIELPLAPQIRKSGRGVQATAMALGKST